MSHFLLYCLKNFFFVSLMTQKREAYNKIEKKEPLAKLSQCHLAEKRRRLKIAVEKTCHYVDKSVNWTSNLGVENVIRLEKL